MGLRKSKARHFFFLVPTIIIAAGCSGTSEEVKDTDVIAGKSDTECSPLLPAELLGEAENAFGCRGTLIEVNGAIFGVARAKKADKFTLLAPFADGKTVTAKPSEHSGKKNALLAVNDGFLVVSVDKSLVRISSHDKTLAQQGLMTEVTAFEGGKVVAFEALALPEAYIKATGAGENAPVAVIAVSTATGVEGWVVARDAAVIGHARTLTYEEMPYCNSLDIKAEGENLIITVGCQEVLPKNASVNAGVATVAEFEYEGEIPPRADIVATVNARGEAVTAKIVTPEADAGDPEGYALKRYVKDQLPRAAGHRVNVLDAIEVADGKVISLACVGPDGGSVQLEAAILECKNVPKE